ncbi:hypothetical protein SEA_KRADAL_335 [Streptomyces phage Kradal]|nr:hypothetical protein SEA_KRADAL_335 [Streptomyces phage Kradal]QPL14643.1 membrane protein [Streptomyces phage EhyElimayoE]
MDTNKIVTVERARLAPFIERVSGADMREGFRDAFDGAAGRFALGKIEAPEFRAIVHELTRDAAGTASQQDRDAGTARVWGTGTNAPENVTRARRWATWPTDGSGRLGPVERVVYIVTAVLVAVVLVWVGVLVGKHGSGGSVGAGVSGAAPVAAESDTPPANVSGDRERELIIEGGYLAWQAWTECGNGPAACHDALRELNANPYGITVMEDGSLIESDRDPNTVTVSLSELPSGDCWWEVKNDGTSEALCSGE